MAAITTTTWANELLRIYTRDRFFEPMERSDTPIWQMFEEADDIEPRGSGLYFRMILNSAHRVGTPTESGDIPGGGTRTTLQGSVTGTQIASSFEISEKQINAGKGDGSFAGDSLHDAIVEATKNLYSHIERLLMVSHGTGKLAEVQDSTVTTTTWVAKLPQSVFNIKPGMLLAFYDLDSGGSVQTLNGSATNATVNSIAFDTRTVTMDIAITLTAGWAVYISGYYGSAPVGIRGIVDDGDLYATYFGNSRSTYPRLKAIVDHNSGTVRPYKEKLIRKQLHRAKHETGVLPDVILCNTGVVGEHLETTIPDRQYTVAGKSVPAYGIGYDSGALFFQFENNKIPFKIILDCPARELYALNRKSFRKHTLRKVGWMGGPSDMLMPTPSGSNSTYKLTYTACLLGDLAISNRAPIHNVKIEDQKDEELAGDS